MKKYLMIVLAVLVMAQCAFAQTIPDPEDDDRVAEILSSLMNGEEALEIQNAVDYEEKTAIPLTEFVHYFFNAETGEYIAFNGDAWGLLYEDSSVKDETSEKNVMTNKPGEIFAPPEQKYCIADYEKLVFERNMLFT